MRIYLPKWRSFPQFVGKGLQHIFTRKAVLNKLISCPWLLSTWRRHAKIPVQRAAICVCLDTASLSASVPQLLVSTRLRLAVSLLCHRMWYHYSSIFERGFKDHMADNICVVGSKTLANTILSSAHMSSPLKGRVQCTALNWPASFFLH